MDDVDVFGVLVTVVAVGVLLAVVTARASQHLRVPAPAIFLVGAAIASDLIPGLNAFTITGVQRVVTVALVLILFDGGMHLGWDRVRKEAGAIVWVGVAGTAVTAAAMAWLAHVLFGFDWATALLLGTALSPTDPAVVFSVLGNREITGRSGVILEGESGANDPVGIALMAALLSVGSIAGWSGIATVGSTFLEQMVIGGALGVAGGLGLRWVMVHVELPGQGLYAIRTLAAALAIYGVTTIAQGSGFLAVFIAGILVGDTRSPFKSEIKSFHSALSSLGEIVAFTLLGLTVNIASLGNGNAWQIGLVLALLLGLVVRPLLVGLVLTPLSLARGERIFVLVTGLKGAVPILLGTYVLETGHNDGTRLYNIIFVVVTVSVILQGSPVPTLARICRVPMRSVDQEPWAVGLRLRAEPQHLHRLEVAAGSAADGASPELIVASGQVWVCLVSRDGTLVDLRTEPRLLPGDRVLVQGDEQSEARVRELFGGSSPT